MNQGSSRPIRIIDATLREGCQAPGVRFTADQSAQIANGLANLGVDQIECGHPSASAEELARARHVAALGIDCPILAHARARHDDIDAVAEAGCSWVGIFLGINGITRRARVPSLSKRQILKLIQECVHHAHGLSLRVRYSLEDASRTDEALALAAFDAAAEAGADRICFADTVGILEPAGTVAWVRRLKERFPEMDLEVHLHDDRGLSLANALAALDAGADWISTAVHGLGERSGITDLCALLANLHYRGQRNLPKGQAVRHLSTLVRAYSRSGPDPRRPLVGSAAFTHTAPLHVKAVCRDEAAYTWLQPEKVGMETSLCRSSLPSELSKLVLTPLAIPATELEFHRAGPGVRHVMIDERLVGDCRQYCIVRDIPRLEDAPDGHVDVHAHHVDSYFLFLGHEPGLRGLKAQVQLGDHVEIVDSPKAVFIPAGVPHTFRLLAGSGIFVNHVDSGSYNESLFTPDDSVKQPRKSASSNPKAAAWDRVGEMFWKLGRKTAKPSAREIDLYLADAGPTSRVCVIGASTKDLVEAAVSRGAQVLVLDFSQTMCDQLERELSPTCFLSRCMDILQTPPDDLTGTQNLVLADRLINRFIRQELPQFLRNSLALLAPGGELRTTVKMGFYPMDLSLIEEGRVRGTLERFYDETTRTLDFSQASEELRARLVPHGDIPREVLLDWYHGRCQESRFEDEDIRQALEEATLNGRRLSLLSGFPCPDAPGTQFYRLGADITR